MTEDVGRRKFIFSEVSRRGTGRSDCVEGGNTRGIEGLVKSTL